MRNLGKAVIWLLGGLTMVRLIFGYIDPNTGGLIFQLLAVIFASFTGIFLFFSRQIRMAAGKFRRRLGGTAAGAPYQETREATGTTPDEK